ncbi:MAG TPA: hypothetical protein VLB73_00185 [Patescibacteria group bacterium]|nr:hypothetical protein [Patescibacteria group bacterium]
MTKGQARTGNGRRYRRPHGKPKEELDEEGNVIKRGRFRSGRIDLKQERQWERNPEQEE